MKNIILLTHGEFSKGIAQSCQFILGNVPNLTALSITLDESADGTVAMIEAALKDFQNDAPTILITDIPGGSTTQAALRALEAHPQLYVLSGLSLGLLLPVAMLELQEDREANLQSLREILEEAKETLTLINDITAGSSVEEEEGEL